MRRVRVPLDGSELAESILPDARQVARGLTIGHITSPARCSPHILTSFARVENGRVTYPDEG
jgi:hypothetical protein